MLDAGTDAGGLDGVDVRRGQHARQKGVFAVGFKVAAAEGMSWDADYKLSVS